MAYVVIVCSRCRLARGASETARTATCPGCGRRMVLAERKKYYRSESLDRVREAIGQLNARLKGGLDIYLDDLYASVPDKKRGPGPPPPGRVDERPPAEAGGLHPFGDASLPPPEGGGLLSDEAEEEARREHGRLRQMGKAVPSNKLDRAIVMCLMGKGALTPEELRPLLPVKCRIGQLEKRLEALRRTGLLYEPRPGRFALVG